MCEMENNYKMIEQETQDYYMPDTDLDPSILNIQTRSDLKQLILQLINNDHKHLKTAMDI